MKKLRDLTFLGLSQLFFTQLAASQITDRGPFGGRFDFGGEPVAEFFDAITYVEIQSLPDVGIFLGVLFLFYYIELNIFEQAFYRIDEAIANAIRSDNGPSYTHRWRDSGAEDHPTGVKGMALAVAFLSTNGVFGFFGYIGALTLAALGLLALILMFAGILTSPWGGDDDGSGGSSGGDGGSGGSGGSGGNGGGGSASWADVANNTNWAEVTDNLGDIANVFGGMSSSSSSGSIKEAFEFLDDHGINDLNFFQTDVLIDDLGALAGDAQNAVGANMEEVDDFEKLDERAQRFRDDVEVKLFNEIDAIAAGGAAVSIAGVAGNDFWSNYQEIKSKRPLEDQVKKMEEETQKILRSLSIGSQSFSDELDELLDATRRYALLYVFLELLPDELTSRSSKKMSKKYVKYAEENGFSNYGIGDTNHIIKSGVTVRDVDDQGLENVLNYIGVLEQGMSNVRSQFTTSVELLEEHLQLDKSEVQDAKTALNALSGTPHMLEEIADQVQSKVSPAYWPVAGAGGYNYQDCHDFMMDAKNELDNSDLQNKLAQILNEAQAEGKAVNKVLRDLQAILDRAP